MRRTTLLTLLLLLALVPAAHASRTQALYFDAQRDLQDPATRDSAVEELASLGVRRIRVVLYWQTVAPDARSRRTPGGDLSDPAAYDWSRYDPVLEVAARRGWKVLLTVTTPGPRWAMRGRTDRTRPSPSKFGTFVRAVSRRYGAQVDEWSILNEPNHPKFLLPQYRKGRPASPRIYRSLFVAADRALRATGNGRDTLLMGETAPRGTRRVVAPITFLRGALCLDGRYRRARRCRRLSADGFAHHAYTTAAGPFFVPPGRNDVTIGVLGRLVRALDRAGRARAIRRRMPIYLTEFGIQSTPDRFVGVSLTRQPEFRAISERLAWGNPRVKAFSQYLLRDDDPIEGVSASERYGGFESGLYFANGRVKRNVRNGFRLPLVAFRSGRRGVAVWGLVRPASGRTTAEVQVRDKGSRRVKRLRTVRTDSRGYFRFRTRYRAGRRYRIGWQQHTGALTRVYRRP